MVEAGEAAGVLDTGGSIAFAVQIEKTQQIKRRVKGRDDLSNNGFCFATVVLIGMLASCSHLR